MNNDEVIKQKSYYECAGLLPLFDLLDRLPFTVSESLSSLLMSINSLTLGDEAGRDPCLSMYIFVIMLFIRSGRN